MSEDAPDVYERASGLVEQLFQAPTSSRAWVHFLGALCGEMSTDAIALLIGQIVPGRAPSVLAHGIDLGGIPTDQLLPMGEQPSEQDVPVGSVITITQASEILARTRLFQNVLAKQGLPPGPGFSLVIGRNREQITAALLVLSRDPHWEPRAEDRALLQLLAPYVRRAISLGLQLQVHRSDEASLLALFDALTLGVVLLDEKGRVSFVNRSAAEVLGTEPGLSAGVEGAAHPRTAAVRALLRTLTIGPDQAAIARHPESSRPLQIFTTPLRWPQDAGATAARFATACFLGDEGRSGGRIEGLAGLYGLTPAEERLAGLLAGGASLAEAAEALSIRLSTARGVLKSVFAKTGTRRQASLVSLLLAAPGLIRHDLPREPAGRS